MGLLTDRFYRTISQTSTNYNFDPTTADEWIDESFRELVSKFATYCRRRVIPVAQGQNEFDRADVIPEALITGEDVDHLFSVEFQPGISGAIETVSDDTPAAAFKSEAHPLNVGDSIQIFMDELEVDDADYTTNFYDKRGLVSAPVGFSAIDYFCLSINGSKVAYDTNASKSGTWVKSDSSNVNRRRISTKTTWEEAQSILSDPINPGASIPAGTLFVSWVMVPPPLSSFSAVTDLPSTVYPKQYLNLIADWAAVKALQSLGDSKSAAIIETRILPDLENLAKWSSENNPIPIQSEGYFKDSAGVHGFRSIDKGALVLNPFANSPYEQAIYDRFFQSINLSGTKTRFTFLDIKNKIDESFGNSAEDFKTYKKTNAIKVITSQVDFDLADIIPNLPTVGANVVNEKIYDIRSVSFIRGESVTLIGVTDDGAGDSVFETGSDHGLAVGTKIRIYNTAINIDGNTLYDGYFTVVSIPTDTTFTCAQSYSVDATGLVVKADSDYCRQQVFQRRSWEDIQTYHNNQLSRTVGYSYNGIIFIEWDMTPPSLNYWSSSDVPDEVFPIQYRGIIADKAAIELLAVQDFEASQRLAFARKSDFEAFEKYMQGLNIAPVKKDRVAIGTYGYQNRRIGALYVSYN